MNKDRSAAWSAAFYRESITLIWKHVNQMVFVLVLFIMGVLGVALLGNVTRDAMFDSLVEAINTCDGRATIERHSSEFKASCLPNSK